MEGQTNRTYRVIYDTSEETRIKEMARIREKALHDEASALKNARDKGFAEGFVDSYIETRVDVFGQDIQKAEEKAISILKGHKIADEYIMSAIAKNRQKRESFAKEESALKNAKVKERAEKKEKITETLKGYGLTDEQINEIFS